MVKIGHHAKATAFAKWAVWVKNLKCQKGAKNESTTTLQLCVKNRLDANVTLGSPDKGQPQHRELHALLFSNSVWVLY